jgi:hypothetical protein
MWKVAVDARSVVAPSSWARGCISTASERRSPDLRSAWTRGRHGTELWRREVTQVRPSGPRSRRTTPPRPRTGAADEKRRRQRSFRVSVGGGEYGTERAKPRWTDASGALSKLSTRMAGSPTHSRMVRWFSSAIQQAALRSSSRFDRDGPRRPRLEGRGGRRTDRLWSTPLVGFVRPRATPTFIVQGGTGLDPTTCPPVRQQWWIPIGLRRWRWARKKIKPAGHG